MPAIHRCLIRWTQHLLAVSGPASPYKSAGRGRAQPGGVRGPVPSAPFGPVTGAPAARARPRCAIGFTRHEISW